MTLAVRAAHGVGPLWAERMSTGSFATALLVTPLGQHSYSTSRFEPHRHWSSSADSDSNPAGATILLILKEFRDT
jgi:hypothetical protein